MAKLISKAKFPLKLKDGAAVRDMEGLREHFDLKLVLGYASSGKLGRWLNVWGMNQEAEALAALDKNAADYVQQLCHILGRETDQVQEQSVNMEDIEHLVAKKQKLKQLTADASIIAKAEVAAFDEAELQELLQQGQKEILLCNASFVIPLEYPCKYIGVGKAEAIIKECVDLEAKGITLEKLKETYEKGKPETAAPSAAAVQKQSDSTQDVSEEKAISTMCQILEGIVKGKLEIPNVKQAEIASSLYKAANNGNAHAMYGMYLLRKYGLGNFSPNKGIASMWLKKAKENGYRGSVVGQDSDSAAGYSAAATPNVSTKSSVQNGIQSESIEELLAKAEACEETGDTEGAWTWYNKAANTGDGNAMDEMGMFLQRYDQSEEAVRWFKKSADAGFAWGMHHYAGCLRFGIGVEENHSQAIQYYLKAAEQGNFSAMSELVTWREADGTYKESVIFDRLCQAVRENNPDDEDALWGLYEDALWGLSVCYERGIGAYCDQDKALSLRLMAAEKGNGYAQYRVEADSLEEFAYALGHTGKGYASGMSCRYSYDGSMFDNEYGYIFYLADVGLFASFRLGLSNDSIYFEAYCKDGKRFSCQDVSSISWIGNKLLIKLKNGNQHCIDNISAEKKFNFVFMSCLLKIACGLKNQLTAEERKAVGRIRLKSRGGRTILDEF